MASRQSIHILTLTEPLKRVEMSKTRSKIACAISILLSVGAATALTATYGANAQRYASVLTPLLDKADGEPIGSLAPGAALEVLGQSGSATHIALHGWSKDGASAIVYLAPTQHVVVLSGFTGHGTPGATQAEGGITYHAVTIDGFVSSSALVDNVQTVWKHAADVFSRNCATCHALPKPDSMSADQWPAILKTQQSNAGIDAKDTALLAAYLETKSGH